MSRAILISLLLFSINCSSNGATNSDLGTANGDMAVMSTDLGAGTDLSAPPDLGVPTIKKICSADYWCWENPLPLGANLNRIWQTSANDGWAVGNKGVIARWDGSSWFSLPSGTELDLQALWGLDANNVWIDGGSGTILKWNGTSLTAQSTGASQVYAIWGIDANNVWAAGSGGTIVKGDYDPAIHTYTDSRMEMSCKLPARPT